MHKTDPKNKHSFYTHGRKAVGIKNSSDNNRQHSQPTARELSGRCPAEKYCGGCQHLALSYEEQLKTKQAELDKLLSGFAAVKPIIGMEDPTHYRNKVHHALAKGKGGEIISGSYAADSHWIVSTPDCLLEDRKCQDIIASIRRLAKSFKYTIYDEDRGTGLFRHILIRRGFASNEILVVLVLSSQILPGKNNFIKALRTEHPDITSIVINVNDADTSMVLGERNITIYGKGYIKDRLCGLSYRISPSSFYQINPVQTEKLYNTALQYADIKKKDVIIDAYCGIGTIGLTAASRAKQLIGIELNADAVSDARINAAENNISNAEFINADATEYLKGMAAVGEHADIIFMDPPRSGSTQEFIASAVKISPRSIVYVSCNPETLKRDLELFRKHGYRVLKIQPVDMFPQTVHVEIVCKLVLRNPVTHVNIDVDVEELVQNQRGQATYEQIKSYVLEHFGLKVSNLYIAQIKQKYGIIERENYNKPKSEDSRVPNCPPEKEQAITEALKYFGMIVT